MSAASSSKSKMAKFSAIRSGRLDLGNTMSPRWTCQRSTTWAGVRPMRAAICVTTGSVEDPAAGDRRPGLDGDAEVLAELPQRVLHQVRVHLDLVDRGDDLALVEQAAQVMLMEVRHPDGAHPAGREHLRHGPPGVDEVAHLRQRPVDQEQVQVVDVQIRRGSGRTPAARRRGRGTGCSACW